MISRFSTIALITLVIVGSVYAGERKYGKTLTLKEKTKISDVLAQPENYNGKKVLVEGPVIGVCEKRGCWIRIGSDKEFESIQFKVEDGVIVFPMKEKGKKVLAEGIVSVKTYSVEEQIEQGNERAKEQGTTFDPASITGPKTIIKLKGEGAVIN